jgi:tRNA-dihydrouridine synthase B
MTTKEFWKNLPKPIIGLAPMDGYSDSAFRRVCKQINPKLITVTEFTSADGIHFNAQKLMKRLSFHPSEQPVIAQIFGKNTETFISAAKVVEDMGFSGIDINMGCPSKKVVKSEHGVALRRNLDKAFLLIETLANATSLPVSVKTRLGWSDSSDLILFGKGAENAGAQMICIHGRTYVEPYNVPAQWNPIYELKKNVAIPILGNGGIKNYNDGISKLGNLDGFLMGQASFGNPWAFNTTPYSPPLSEKIPLILQHAQWLVEDKGERMGMREIRKHLVQYIKGVDGAKAIRSQLVRVESIEEIKDTLSTLNSYGS